MKVLVLGAGVIGVTTAYQLARDGHEVIVVEREAGPASQAEGLHAGLVCPSYIAPWAAPGMRARAVHWPAQRESAFKPGRPVDVSVIRWIMMWAGQCKPDRYIANRYRMHRLARYSLHQLQALRRALGIQYESSSEGVLQIVRTDEEVRDLARLFPLLDELGIPYTALDRAGCLAVDPALEYATSPFLGGLYLPMDETGDCLQFTHALARHAEALGVQFRYGCTAGKAIVERDALLGIETDKEYISADRTILALGAGSVQWLHDNAYVVPVQRVKTYALSAPVNDLHRAPRTGIVDEHNKLWITRAGMTLHAAGMAELDVRNTNARAERGRLLADTVDRLFPGAADLTRASVSTLMQAATPDGPPVLGAGHWANLYFNLGHGFHAWTMACGAAKILADLIAGRQPEIDLDGLTYDRYHTLR